MDCVPSPVQRGGLPHAHVILKLPHALDNPATIDHYVQAYLPDAKSHPRCNDPATCATLVVVLIRLYAKVMKHQWHPPDHSSCKKNSDGSCKYKYPKEITEVTQVLESGYCSYKRPEIKGDGTTGELSDEQKNMNSWVVATNFTLLDEFDCHINVEVCYTVNVLKYLFKYIKKGSTAERAWAKINSEMDNDVDEISEYIARRILSACEGSWRIFGFHMKRQWPAATQLLIHLPGQDNVRYDANDADDIEKALCGQSTLERYFNRCACACMQIGVILQICRPLGPAWRNQTYSEYHSENILYSSINQVPFHARDVAWLDNTTFARPATWQMGQPVPVHHTTAAGIKRQWVCPREADKPHLARLTLLTPKAGEVFYLRALLKNFTARSYDELYNVSGVPPH
jgi:hypothetical protein